METAVITYIDDNVLENLEKDFLKTLRKKALYKGRVFVIYYGKKFKKIQRIAEKYKVDIFFAKNIFRVSNQRNIDIVGLLIELPQEIEQVMCIDGGDVWFQSSIDDIFELTKNNYGFAEEDEFADQFFNLSSISQIKDQKIKEIFFRKAKGLKIANIGMIAGKKEKVGTILKGVADFTQKINQDFFGLDQAIFNYIVRNDGSGIILPQKFNYSLITKKDKFKIKNGLFYDENKEIINVVHNTGGDLRLFPKGRKSLRSFIIKYLPFAIFVKDFSEKISYRIDRILGISGIFLKRYFPWVYFTIKKQPGNYFLKNEVKKILADNWVNYKKDIFPKNRRMKIIEENGVKGLSSENVRFLINELVKNFAQKGVYFEVGTYQGGSLLSAALFNDSCRCIGTDNFSEIDDGNNERILNENLVKLDKLKNIEFYNVDCKKAIKEIFSKEPGLKVNVYFYDGQHSYENQLEGLRIMLPYLAAKSVIVVDDLNWERVERANKDFLLENPDFTSLFLIKTKGDQSEDWWNGIEVLGRFF